MTTLNISKRPTSSLEANSSSPLNTHSNIINTTGGSSSSSHVESGMGTVSDQQQMLSHSYNPPKSPRSVLRRHLGRICDLVSNTTKLGNDLCEADLIPEAVLDRVKTNKSLCRYDQVDEYMSEIRRTIKVMNNPETIVSLCDVLEKQNDKSLNKVIHSMRIEVRTYISYHE